MTRVLVVWEDEYFDPLHEITKRLVRALMPQEGAVPPSLLRHTTRGNAAFHRYASVTWPLVRARGLPGDPGPIDHLVCVVDADHLHDLLPNKIEPPPSQAVTAAAWHFAAQHTWQEHLRAQCDPSGPPPSTVHGLALRWAKESLLLAGYDRPPMKAHLDVDIQREDIAKALAQCAPPPREVQDQHFTNTYRHPSRCLSLLRKKSGLGPLHKSAPEIDDALSALAKDSLDTLRARVPDMDRLASLIWQLHRGEAPPAPASGAKKPRKK